jgi:hypothetical protein
MVKIFFKNIYKKILNYFSQKEKFYKKVEAYLNQFKIERTKTESILIECLFKLEFLSLDDRRYIGAAEAILIMEGFLNKGTKFEYQKTKRFHLFFTWETKENYKEHIIKHIKLYLREKGVM